MSKRDNLFWRLDYLFVGKRGNHDRVTSEKRLNDLPTFLYPVYDMTGYFSACKWILISGKFLNSEL